MGKGEIIPRLAPPNPHIILREWDGQGHRLGPTIRLLLAPGAQAGPIAFPLEPAGRAAVREILRDWNLRVIGVEVEGEEGGRRA